MKTKPVIVFPTTWAYIFVLMHSIPLSRTANHELHLGSLGNSLGHENVSNYNLPVLYDSSSVDAEMQNDLMKSVLLALGVGSHDIRPLFIDISSGGRSLARFDSLQKSVKILRDSKVKVVVSLIESEELFKFTHLYEKLTAGATEKLHVYTPRAFSASQKFPSSVTIKSLQMSESARAVALLNRVRNVGVKTLIPILDDDSASQLEMLKLYHRLGKVGGSASRMVKFAKPILLNQPTHAKKLKMMLQEHSGFHESHLKLHDEEISANLEDKLKPGILLLAKKESHLAMKIAAQRNHLLLSWFSPNIMEIEEWAHRPTSLSRDYANSQKSHRMDDSEAVHSTGQDKSDSMKGTAANNSLIGLYSVNFVGSTGWDNPNRRRVLRELATFTGASPRIVSTILAYDAALLARDHVKNELHFPTSGLSGEISFNEKGFRKNGTYLGASSVPKPTSSDVALLQPSTWILEDIISVTETDAGKLPEVTDYDVATSSIITRDELVHIANSTRSSIGCSEHLMNIITYDPFNQMPYHYYFTEANLPETIMVPNTQGFGITFICSHNRDSSSEETRLGEKEADPLVSTLQVACTPGSRMTHPINCFRSHVNRRQRRAVAGAEDKTPSVPSVQYQYSLSGSDPWLSQSSKWAASKQDNPSQYYYQPNSDYNVESVTYGYPTTRLDIPIAEEPSSTPAPAPTGTASKLPELRQILKATKPFVGSCIGSSTGCAICVLVLGRLPLGNNPTACTGPCFVGTFGSCGALLGRVFAETTVICTELFRQGLLDVDTFVADAEFGNYLSEASPYTMKGYTILATPLVDLMRSSKLATDVVATFALPWARHMKYLLGRSEETSLLGSVVHLVGYPLCNIVGSLFFLFHNFTSYLSYSILIVSPFLTFVVTLIYILACTNLGFSTSCKRRLSLFQIVFSLSTLLNLVRVTVRRAYFYFKAIGRST